jgi:flagellar M-ring protein FliF
MPSWEQIVALWRGLSSRQQITIIAGGLLLAGTLAVFVQFMGKDDMSPLYSGLGPGEAQNIAKRLDSQKIAYEISPDGASIRVPTGKLDAVRVDMASQGMPSTGRLGFELFDQPNWTGSDFAEKVNYQRALEGELERTIQTIGGVEAVRVHLVLPKESLFSDHESEAKASIVLKLRGGRLPDDSIYAITHLVAGSVEGLQPENVTLIDADGRMPIMVSGKGGSRRASEPDTAMEDKLVAALAPVVGIGRVKASVTVDYDLSSTEISNEVYDPNQTVVLTSSITEENTQGAGPAGIPGTTSNVPTGKPPAATNPASGDSSSQKAENKTFGVTRTVKHTLLPAGQIKRIAAAVLIDDAMDEADQNGQTVQKRRKRTTQEMQRLQEIASAAIGIDTQRGDKLAVQNLSFEGLPVNEKPEPPSGFQRFTPIIDRYIGSIRYVALLLLFVLVYLLVLRPVKKQILTAVRQVPARLKAENQAALAAAAGGGALPATAAAGEALPAGDGQRTLKLKQQLTDTVRKEPVGASQAVQALLKQG